jgi:hypothetical protein
LGRNPLATLSTLNYGMLPFQGVGVGNDLKNPNAPIGANVKQNSTDRLLFFKSHREKQKRY